MIFFHKTFFASDICLKINKYQVQKMTNTNCGPNVSFKKYNHLTIYYRPEKRIDLLILNFTSWSFVKERRIRNTFYWYFQDILSDKKVCLIEKFRLESAWSKMSLKLDSFLLFFRDVETQNYWFIDHFTSWDWIWSKPLNLSRWKFTSDQILG